MAWMDILNLLLGILGAVGIFQMGYSAVHSNLPAQKLKVLDDNFNDTNIQFRSVIEDGLLVDPQFTRDIENHLHNIRYKQEELRAKVHSATTFKQQLHGWTSGLSKKISQLSAQTLLIRARISTTSEDERRRLESEGRLVRRPLTEVTSASPSVQDASVTRRIMNPAFRRLLNAGAPFSGNTLTTLLQASRSPHDAQDALRSAIPLVPLYPPVHAPTISTPSDQIVAASGTDVGSHVQDLRLRSHAVPLASTSEAIVVPDAGRQSAEDILPPADSSGASSRSNDPAPGQDSRARFQSSSGREMTLDGLFKTITQLSSTVAVLSAAVETRRAAGTLGGGPPTVITDTAEATDPTVTVESREASEEEIDPSKHK